MWLYILLGYMVIGIIIAEGAVRFKRLHPNEIPWDVDTKVYSFIVIFWLLYIVKGFLQMLGFIEDDN